MTTVGDPEKVFCYYRHRGVVFYLFQNVFTRNPETGNVEIVRKVIGWCGSWKVCERRDNPCKDSSQFNYDTAGKLKTARYDFCIKTSDRSDCATESGRQWNDCVPPPSKVSLGTIDETFFHKNFTSDSEAGGNSNKPPSSTANNAMKNWVKGKKNKLDRKPDWYPNHFPEPKPPGDGKGCLPSGWGSNWGTGR